jgi:hypothetical protein
MDDRPAPEGIGLVLLNLEYQTEGQTEVMYHPQSGWLEEAPWKEALKAPRWLQTLAASSRPSILMLAPLWSAAPRPAPYTHLGYHRQSCACVQACASCSTHLGRHKIEIEGPKARFIPAWGSAP